MSPGGLKTSGNLFDSGLSAAKASPYVRIAGSTAGKATDTSSTPATALPRLAEKMKVSLQAYGSATVPGDSRARAMGINALHQKMSTKVRSALGGTPVMMSTNNRMRQEQENSLGKLDNDKYWPACKRYRPMAG